MANRPDEDEDPFLVTSELEIRSILRSIQRQAVLVRMYAHGQSHQSILTTILDLDDERKRVVVDCAPDTELNARLLQAKQIQFDTQIHQVSIEFSTEELTQAQHDGLPALSFPFPQSLRRLQRREYYRVEIPVGEPISCTIPIQEAGKPPRKVFTRLKNISAGGLALLDTDNMLPHQSGITFKGARLSLPEVGEAVIDLEVLRVHTVELPNKKKIVELGCQFVDIPNSTSLLIQSYIGRLERRLSAKKRGF